MNRSRMVVSVSLSVLMIAGLIFTNGYVLSVNNQRSGSTPSAGAASCLESHISQTHKANVPGCCRLPQTGQKISYAAGDDGDLQKGASRPDPRFSDTGDATVIDHFSGLMWTRNADKGNGKVDWAQAIAGAAACTDGGFTDWRLPNRHELASLIDLGKYNPALPAGHPFIGVQPSYYWTSSTPANNEDHAWLVHFYIGFVTHDDKGGSHFAWFVRDGK